MAGSRFDLVVLGSGSAAFAASLRAAEMGKTVAMTESRVLGGTCVNRGCLPSKNLIEAARVAWDAGHPRFGGIAGASLPVDFSRLVVQKDEIIEQYRDRKYESIIGGDRAISVFEGVAHLNPDLTVSVGDEVLAGENVLIATGTRPQIVDIPGLDDVPYLTSDLLGTEPALELREAPASLIILGAGYVALELGQLFHRLGTHVTILSRSLEILHTFEPETGAAVHEAFAGEGIEVLAGARVRSVRGTADGVEVDLSLVDGDTTRAAERLLVATGRAPNSDHLGLDAVGVATDEWGYIKVDEYLRTANPRVYAVGDVIGANQGSQLATPVGAHDGGIAAANALGAELRAVDHSVVPRAIFIEPQVAVVGLNNREANEAGYRCSCRTVPMSLVPRAAAIRDTKGFVKMVRDADTDRVLGVTMVGREASEVIHEAAMALRLDARVQDFVDMIHIYPTMAEALKIVALSFFKDVSKLSCCAE